MKCVGELRGAIVVVACRVGRGVCDLEAISSLGGKLPRRGVALETVEAGSGIGLSRLGNLRGVGLSRATTCVSRATVPWADRGWVTRYACAVGWERAESSGARKAKWLRVAYQRWEAEHVEQE